MSEIPLEKPTWQDLKPGTQIVYIPYHVQIQTGMPVLEHPDIQMGFVTSTKEDTNNIFCRYFYPKDLGGTLRTLANSEGAGIEQIWLHKHHSQRLVDRLLKLIKTDTMTYETMRKAIGK